MNTITALYAGKIRGLEPEGQMTGIFKTPIDDARVTSMGIIGDHQADKRVHGGPEKALHQYAIRSYQTIVDTFPLLAGVAIPGSIGENISALNMDETNVCIGDIYQIGSTRVQVSQPRSPCWKINHKFDTPQLAKLIETVRIMGWYYRVLEEGAISVGDEIKLLERANPTTTIDHFMSVMRQHRPDVNELEALSHTTGLNPEWTETMQKRCAYLRKKQGA